MKTSLAGFNSGCPARHASRAAAVSGRSCSAARCDFFSRQPQLGQRARQQSRTGRGGMRPVQPNRQFGQGDIRSALHLGADGILERGQFRPHVPPLRTRRTLTGLSTPRDRLGDVGDAHPKQLGRLAHAQSAVHARKNPIPQILRIRLAPSPGHLASGPRNRKPVNHRSPPCRNPPDSSHPGTALEARAAGLDGLVASLFAKTRAHGEITYRLPLRERSPAGIRPRSNRGA